MKRRVRIKAKKNRIRTNQWRRLHKADGSIYPVKAKKPKKPSKIYPGDDGGDDDDNDDSGQ